MAPRLSDRRTQAVVLVLFAGVVLYNVLHFTDEKPRRVSVLLEESVLESELGAGAAPNWATGQYSRPDSWGRNPFTGEELSEKPAHAEPATQARPAPRPVNTDFNISGIMVSGDRKYILVGDRLLEEGDRLGLGRIKSINKNSVTVEYDTGTKTIYVD